MNPIHDLSVPQEVPSLIKLQQRGFVLARTEFKEHRVWFGRVSDAHCHIIHGKR